MDLESQLVRYVGRDVANTERHDGQLPLAVGVHCVQVLRANRSHPEWADDLGCTYNHAPMLAYWNDKFYLEYLNGLVNERDDPGRTMLVTSEDGLHWGKPVIVFPAYRIPEGVYDPPDGFVLPAGSYAVMHQRMGFFVAPNGRLLTYIVNRLVFRTGPRRREPNLDADRDMQKDLPGADEPVSQAVYYINRVTTTDHLSG